MTVQKHIQQYSKETKAKLNTYLEVVWFTTPQSAGPFKHLKGHHSCYSVENLKAFSKISHSPLYKLTNIRLEKNEDSGKKKITPDKQLTSRVRLNRAISHQRDQPLVMCMLPINKKQHQRAINPTQIYKWKQTT